MKPSDLFLAAELPDQQVREYLSSLGFRDPSRADRHLQLIAEDYALRQALGRAAEPLMESLGSSPDPDAALLGFERYLSTRSSKVNFVNYLYDDPQALDLLTRVLGSSPFLSEILIRNPEYFHWLRQEYERNTSETAHDGELAGFLSDSLHRDVSKVDALKRFKRREILRIAARDLLGKETLQSATAQLSSLADAVMKISLQILAQSTPRRDWPGVFCVIGMGKLGGRELNYSSDIDLMYAYQPDDATVDSEKFFQKLSRELTRLLSAHTEESYLYRVDLRLRPLGKTGRIAYSLEQYRSYYETTGETFERFALIKARPVAGEMALGRRFVEMTQPFVYRRYLDYVALEEIVQIKSRSDAESRSDNEMEQNVKTGRGGIREIELFTQVFQLLYGNEYRELRESNTLEALAKLLRAKLISESVCEDLTRAYIFLRTVEHRLQIVQESQTHSLPVEPTEREICARRLGFKSAALMDGALAGHRNRVREVYESLLAEESRLTRSASGEFFRALTEESWDSRTVERLRAYGFHDPTSALDTIGALDRAPSLVHSRSATRNLLANLLAEMLPEVGRHRRAERVLNRIEQVATAAGAASSFFRSLLENHKLRQRLVSALASGELLAQRLIRYPELLDSLLLPAVAFEHLAMSFDRALQSMQPIPCSDRLNPLRRFKLAEEFKVLIGWLAGEPLENCQKKLSLLAEQCVGWTARWHDPEVRSGRSQEPGKSERQWLIFALGKLGSCELSVHSDLDLVFLYRGQPRDSRTFMRYQSFVREVESFLERPTEQGVAYRIDTRLRPEGNKGALAMPLGTFKRYLTRHAQKWERLAWTRSRFLAGSAGLAAEASRDVQSFVYGPWDSDLVCYVEEIRSRMEEELSEESDGTKLNFKVGRGGMADIDFILQLIQIRRGAEDPSFRVTGTSQLLGAASKSKLLNPAEVAVLDQARRFLRQLEIFVRMDQDSNINWILNDPDTLEPVAQQMGVSDLLGRYRETTEQVRTIYERVMERLKSEPRA